MMTLNSFIPVNNYDFRASCSEVNSTCYPEFEVFLQVPESIVFCSLGITLYLMFFCFFFTSFVLRYPILSSQPEHAKNAMTVHCFSVFFDFTHVTRRPCWWSIQYKFFSQNLHKNKVQFPPERKTIVLDHQHGRHDVTCNQAILNGILNCLTLKGPI